MIVFLYKLNLFFRLLVTDVTLPEDLLVTYTTKTDGNSSIQLVLLIESQDPVTLGSNKEHEAQDINGWTKRYRTMKYQY